MELSEIIIRKIEQNGPISFHDFMTMALYYPGSGYYNSSRSRIGPTGDYYTSPCITSIFGALIGKQIEEMWHLCERKEFTIVEYGAGTGTLCSDILNQIKHNKELYNKIRYCIIENNIAEKKDKADIDHENIIWSESIDDISLINGCILSNELIDNFPVHRVVMEDQLMEIFVDYDDGFSEILRPAPDAVRDYLAELNVCLPKGFRTEINLQAIKWIEEISNKLQKGFVMTIDYGFPSSELYHEKRRSGTLLCYHKHKINNAPYINIGEQDITTHVNFSALYHWGLKSGLNCCGFTNQANFLRALGLTDHIRMMEQNGEYSTGELREKLFMVHNLLIDMGTKLKVLIQQKGMQMQPLSAFNSFQDTRTLTIS